MIAAVGHGLALSNSFAAVGHGLAFAELNRRFPFSAAQVTESAFRRLGVALSSLGIYYYEVVPAGSGNAGVPRWQGGFGGAARLIFIDFH